VCSSTDERLKPAIQEHIRALTSLREQARQIRAQDDSDNDASDDEVCPIGDVASASGTLDTGAGASFLEDIDFYTKCLMDLLPSMEQIYKNARDPCLRLEERSGKISFHVTEAARPYVLQVHDKFRDAKTSLVERLGEANWQRFMRVRHCMASVTQDDDAKDFETGARSAFFPGSKFHDSGLGNSLPTESSFALSVASHSSFVSSLAEEKGSSARVPPTPNEVAEGLPFECFICKRTLNRIKTRVDWK
jgi:hypothetical protein